jgi:biopolymer transport protein ExbD
MKFPRNAKIFRGHLDAAPFAGVFFLLVIFLLLASLVYTPGVHIELPMASSDLAGVDGPKVAVAVDKNGRLYYENKIIETNELKLRLQAAVAKSSEPLTLVVQPDKDSKYEMCVRLAELARSAGITNAWMETLPGIFDKRTSFITP